MWLWSSPNEEGREGGERGLNYLPSAMFLEGFVEAMKSEIRNADIYTCYSIPFLFVENHFAFTVIILSFKLQDIEQNF